MRVRPWVWALLVGCAAVPADGWAGDGRSFTLRAVVPVVCSIDGMTAAADGRLWFDEFCNVAQGYRVYAHHPPATAAVVRFRYDGRWMRADPSGVTLLADEPTAGRHRRSLEIERGLAQVPVTLSIVPR